METVRLRLQAPVKGLKVHTLGAGSLGMEQWEGTTTDAIRGTMRQGDESCRAPERCLGYLPASALSAASCFFACPIWYGIQAQ